MQTIVDKVYGRVIDPAVHKAFPEKAADEHIQQPAVKDIPPYTECPQYEADGEDGCPIIPEDIQNLLVFRSEGNTEDTENVPVVLPVKQKPSELMVGEGQDTSEDWTAVVVGIVCGVVLCAIIITFFWCYKRDMQKPTEGQGSEEHAGRGSVELEQLETPGGQTDRQMVPKQPARGADASVIQDDEHLSSSENGEGGSQDIEI